MKKKNTDRPLDVTDDVDMRFVQFWAIYPRRTAKIYALKSWRRLKPSPALAQEIIRGVEMAKNKEWIHREEELIPHAATFLNQARWQDYEHQEGQEIVPVMVEKGMHICDWCPEKHVWMCNNPNCEEEYLACKTAHWRLVGRHEPSRGKHEESEAF